MKKLLKRAVTPVLALGAIMVLAAGCNETNDDSGYVAWDASKSPKSLNTTITWWNNYQEPDSSVTEEAARGQSKYREYFYAKDLIAEFNKLYPNIKVNTVYKGSYNNIQTAVNTGLNSGDVPNIATCYPDHVAGYSKAGATLEMDGFLTDPIIGLGKTIDANGKVIDDQSTLESDLNANYFSNEKKQYKSGKYLSLPYSKSAESMVINKTVFEKVGAGECGTTVEKGYTAPTAAASKKAYSIPTSWTELAALGRQMLLDYPELFDKSTTIDSDGLLTAIPVCYDSAENMFISFAEMMGIKYTSNATDSVAEQILFKNDDAKNLLVQLKKWVNEGWLGTQSMLYYTNKASGYHQYSSTMLANGKCFICFSSTAGARYFAADGFVAEPEETPVIDSTIYGSGTATTAKSKVISQGPSLTFFQKENKDEEYASWIFYKFLTNTDNSANLASNANYFPLRTSSNNSTVIKTLTDAAKETMTVETAKATKGNNYTGKMLELNKKYTSENRYFTSPVFDLSSTCRTAIGNMMTAILDDKTAKTDAEIEQLVNDKINSAYTSVVTK